MVQSELPDNKFMSNTAVVPVGSDGKLRLLNDGGPSDAVVDLQGYFTTSTVSTGTGGFVPITATRAVDSRSNIGTTGGALATGGTRTVTLATAGVPANATSVFINLLIPSATSSGLMSLTAGTSTTTTDVGGRFDYVEGSSSSGMSVKLSGGKATLYNTGGDTADFVIDIEGYWSPTPTVGGGYRAAAGRVLDTRNDAARVQAGATIDMQVGGANGLPIQGIAGVLMDIHSKKASTGATNISAWPTGATRPGTSVNNNPGSTSRVSLNIIKTGTDGKISIRNNGTA